MFNLYIDNRIRDNLVKPYELFKKTYMEKIVPVFSNIEEEAKEIAEKSWEELGRYFNPDYDDPADFAEHAQNEGLEYFEGMSLMEYNTRLMWVSTLYQFWEQQVRKFLFDEVGRWLRWTGNKPIKMKDFCKNGVVDIKSVFNHLNFNIENMTMWGEINKLRLLTNTIKHADGGAATSLRAICPQYFYSEYSTVDLLELYNTTLNERVLNVSDQDFIDFCDNLIKFWDELNEEFRPHQKLNF
ncbi:hypothetical protein [Brevibacillus invocatus]|uniref:hypothetical protein n=1 Tax=Brevibacillus invocatus TaxID=173959 RepID=UPI00203A58F1|nr:hypothetical protein [Brevibacillus invocatus]MCM3079597.1 hypothetical protein [Brevibacillus invocatus]MCM3429795.1 hypothetical protein [Brevibacillus invocatus]